MRDRTTRGEAGRIVPALLGWFRQNARDLPWRRTRDPYAIWISEIMLQQTQVKTVIPYWTRWMTDLPGIRELAEARPEKTLKLWEGLGYYTRVRNLQKAAQQIVAQHAGKFPLDFNALLALPGIGRYTAGAICSIAFNQPTPILDGNVMRVLTRLFGIAGNPRDKKANVQLWALAQELVSNAAKTGTPRNQSCSRLNQALMELGALICLPAQPDCRGCPVRTECVAHRTDQVGTLPNLERRRPATARRFAAFVIENRGRLLVRQRPAGGINAHLWEFPNVELTAVSVPLREVVRELLRINPGSLQAVCVVKHTITRYRITLEAYRCRLKHRRVDTTGTGRWLRWTELNALPFTSAHRKILNALFPGKPSKRIAALFKRD